MKKTDYTELKSELDKYISGEINAADLKHTAAPFGIYQQRNDLFMIRIRIVGGELSIDKLQTISEVMKEFDVRYCHITTRQDLQLHDVKAENIYKIVLSLTEKYLPFRGGGGNTFRNIIVSPESGISEDSVFDVYPYAKALNKYMMNYDKAFELPRKLKIGFSSSGADSINAELQDLGFIARHYRNEVGFKVYVGGGMGRDSRYGIKLFNSLPPGKIAQCAKAVTDLFYDHGDRENRNQARLRFVLNRLGEDEFTSLFQDYYLRSFADLPRLDDSDLEHKISDLYKLEKKDIEGFKEWEKYAVSSTRFGDDIVSLKLFLPKGDLKAIHLDKLKSILNVAGISVIRLTTTQDVVLPMVFKESLSYIYSMLSTSFEDIDVVVNSFKGHLLSCVGAKICKIGVVDAPMVADKIAEKLDEYFKSNFSKKAEFINKGLSGIKISGCLNTCSGHFLSKIGLSGMKKKIDGELKEGVVLKEEGIEEERFIPLSEIPETVIKVLRLR